ncbi:MAG: ABC transporter substrate-binding protein, partial [Pseudolabrys sp.]
HELVPTSSTMGLLINPTSPNLSAIQSKAVQVAARARGVELLIVQASTEREIELAFNTLAQRRVGGVVISADALFTGQREQLGVLSARRAIPAIYQWREFAKAGGLMSYGTSLTDTFRRVGVYAGRILNGEKPGDLPVQQAAKIELIINLKTAKALGVNVPNTLIGRADEVIE